jgi:hypothetical protein
MANVPRRSPSSSGTRCAICTFPAQLVVYPNEGHGFSDPADRRDVLERAVDWFARYMPPNP